MGAQEKEMAMERWQRIALPLLLAIGLAGSAAARAEGGCPPGMYPIGGQGASGCAPIPVAGPSTNTPRPPPMTLYTVYVMDQARQRIYASAFAPSGESETGALQSNCAQDTGAPCSSLGWASNQCAAVARSPVLAVAMGTGTSATAANRDALARCNAGAPPGTCALWRAALCSGQKYDRKDNVRASRLTETELRALSARLDKRGYRDVVLASAAGLQGGSAAGPSPAPRGDGSRSDAAASAKYDELSKAVAAITAARGPWGFVAQSPGGFLYDDGLASAQAAKDKIAGPNCASCTVERLYHDTCVGIAWVRGGKTLGQATAIDADPSRARATARAQCTASAQGECVSMVRCSGKAYANGYLGGSGAE